MVRNDADVPLKNHATFDEHEPSSEESHDRERSPPPIKKCTKQPKRGHEISQKNAIMMIKKTQPATRKYLKPIDKNGLQLLLKMPNFNDNQQATDDRGHKLSPLVNKLLEYFQRLVIPSEYACLVEILVPFEGQLSFLQYISSFNEFGTSLRVTEPDDDAEQEKRFAKQYELCPEINEAVLASCFHPSFKLKWFPEDLGYGKKIGNLCINTAANAESLQDAFRDLHVIRRPIEWDLVLTKEAFHPDCLKRTLKLPASVMVWGSMSAKGIGKLHFIKGTVDANKYLQILEESLLPLMEEYLTSGQDFIFQQDRAASQNNL
ncbi:hypothetical protein ILUMI_27253 [Ignelater luminosus]|uniref:PiggyBac transposable element-derived protein domain-containing protein n=1 Tax=Ignelater luminosus TaxID=2038154 RepID=A0A8K0C5H0_IGNLU|nr:hypothetical protein ILUMI_27253 [Ignelater luminosus]